MQADILIVGGGVSGLLSGLELARAGLSVTIIERGEPGRESTWAGAGILSPLLPWDYGMEVNSICHRSQALWPRWIEFIHDNSPTDPEYWRCGMLVLGNTGNVFAGQPANADDVSVAPPPLPIVTEPPWLDNGTWLPHVAQIRNPRLSKSLVEASGNLGVRILAGTEVLSLSVNQNQIKSINTSNGTLSAGTYVITAGAWSQALIGPYSASLDIQPVRGQILLFQRQPGVLPCIVYRTGHYLVPRKDGLILAGSTLEHAGYDKSTTLEARHELLEFARSTLPCLAASEPIRQWSGLRPGSPDNVPTISRHPEIENLYLNSGHFRYGVTMAPASSELLLSLILDRPPRIDPEPYRWRNIH